MGRIKQHEKALEKELEQYKKKVGELTLVVDYFKKTLEGSRRMRRLDSSVVREIRSRVAFIIRIRGCNMRAMPTSPF